jgi:hypothetical protein
MGEMRNEYKILVGNPERRKSLRRPKRKQDDNIEMDLRAVGCLGVDWIRLAHNRDQ